MKQLEGQTLGGRYRVVRLLGQGGMGAVFEAIQLDLGRRVALKVLLEVDPRGVERFRREALAASSLSSPHLVAVHDFQAEGATPFLVMELLEGQSLAALLRAQSRLDPARAVRIGCQILVALETAHRAGVLHRDVKPSNIWLQTGQVGAGSGDHVKLLDFGIAKLARHDLASLTTATSLLGSPAYLAPEQLRGLDVDARSDLHAVGVVLFEMIAGERPFRGEGSALLVDIVGRVPPPLHAMVPGIPLALSIVVARALAKDPEVRHARADEMRAALAACLEVGALDAGRTLEDAPTTSSRRVFVVGLAVPLGIAAVAGVGLAWRVRAAAPEAGSSPFAAADASAPAAADAARALADAPDASDAPAAVALPSPRGRRGAQGLPSGGPAPPSPPSPGAPSCECRTAAGAVICTVPKAPSCDCMVDGGAYRACPVPFVSGRCPVPGAVGPYGGAGSKTGASCTGYSPYDDTKSMPGTLACTTCWGHESLAGVHGAACSGTLMWNGAASGTLVCK